MANYNARTPELLTICPKSPQDRPPDGHKWSKSPPLEGHQEAHGFIKTQISNGYQCVVLRCLFACGDPSRGFKTDPKLRKITPTDAPEKKGPRLARERPEAHQEPP